MRAATASLFLATLSIPAASADSAPRLQRTPIATHDIAPARQVASVPVTRLDFKPGQVTGRHTHPVPVIGYVLDGEFIVKVEGQPEQHFKAGQSVYEPADTVIERFDNASASQPAVLIAAYLVDKGRTELIKFLPKQ